MPEKNESATRATHVASEGHRETVSVASRQAEPEPNKCKCCEKIYFSKPENWVSLGTLIAVVIYTGITACVLFNSSQQVAISRGTEVRQLRAYIGIENEDFVLNCEACDDPTKQAVFERGMNDDNLLIFQLKKFGQTPAAKLKGIVNLIDAAFGKDLAADFSYADIPPNAKYPFSPVVVDPQQTAHFGGLLSAGQVDLIKRARKHDITLYFYGHIDYTDVFKCDAVLQFCYRYSPDAKPEHRFTPCPNHNAPPKDCEP